MSKGHAYSYQRQQNNWDLILCRFDKEDGETLRKLAKERHVSIAEVIRECVTWRLENDNTRIRTGEQLLEAISRRLADGNGSQEKKVVSQPNCLRAVG